MKWVEVITVRSSGRNTNMTASILQELLTDMDRQDKQERIRIYNREEIDTDFCIMLFHEGRKITSNGSRLGLRLKAALKEFGQVHHAVWLEMKSQ